MKPTSLRNPYQNRLKINEMSRQIFNWFLIAIKKSMKKCIKKKQLIFHVLLFKRRSQNVGPGEPKWRPKWKKFVENSGPLLRNLPGEGLGRIFDGFGEDFRRILEGFGRLGEPNWRLKSMNFVDISLPRPRRPPREGLGRVQDRLGKDFGRVLYGFGRI